MFVVIEASRGSGNKVVCYRRRCAAETPRTPELLGSPMELAQRAIAAFKGELTLDPSSDGAQQGLVESTA